MGTASVSVDEQAPASTKRAKLIGMLEQPEGATVAEIGQRLGWLPHTVRAAITGLRKAGREVTRSKDANEPVRLPACSYENRQEAVTS